MVGHLAYGQADICAGGLSITLDRSEDIDFSVSLLNVPSTLVVGNPNYGSYVHEAHLNMSGYLKVFSVPVWISLLAFALMFGMTLTMCGYDDRRRVLSVFAASLSSYGLSLLQLCFRPSSPRVSAKMANLLMGIFGMTIFIAYTSDLTAQMTVGDQQRFPRTFWEVINEEYSIFVAKSASPGTYLKQSPSGSPEKIAFDKHVTLYDYPLDGNMEPIIQRMLKDPKTAHFGGSVDFLGEERVKEIQFDSAVKGTVHFGFQKHSELRELFDYHLVKLDQSGTIDKIYQRWLGQSKPEEDLSDRIFVEESKPIGVKNMIFPGFLLLAFTLLASVIAIYDKCHDLLYNKGEG